MSLSKGASFFLLLVLACNSFGQQVMEYPKAKKAEQIDDYHGTKVADPYRWLENPDSADSRVWIDAQNRLTNSYLAQISQRKKIKDRLTKLWNYERFSAPFKRGGKYFYSKNDGLQNQSVLYVTNSLSDKGRILLDPNTLSADGTVALSGYSISQDGRYMAYSLSSGGSDWQEWRVREVDTGKDLSDVLKWSKFSGASWTKDGLGFYYSRYPEPKEDTKLEDANVFQKLYYHKIGTTQTTDVLVYESKDDKDMGFGGRVTEDGKWLVITTWKDTSPRNLVHVKRLDIRSAPVLPLIDKLENEYSFIGNDGANFYFKTDKDAPRGKVIVMNALTQTAASKLKIKSSILKKIGGGTNDVIPQAADKLDEISFVNNQFVTTYLKDAYSQTKIYDLKGNFVRDVEFPGIGSVSGFGGERFDTETFYSFTSFTTPSTVYRYDMVSGRSSVYRQTKVDFNPSNYEVKQVFYSSKDSTRVPMFIVHKKGLKLDGSNPTMLYGYGGFSVSMTPSFSVSQLVWMEMGGVFAMPNLRGGAEYGEEWHVAGTKDKKQNVFDDFIAAAEWLIANKYTQSKKLAISGGSNGGLLVGACLNQRPELFGAALPAVGVMDMLRFHKFTIGWAWVSDYGSADIANEFPALYAYSPLHNIKKGGNYPPVLVTTADHDDRVVPAHSFKYTATLQENQGGSAPILIRIETKAGHGAGKPTAKQIEEVADVYGFLVRSLGMNY